IDELSGLEVLEVVVGDRGDGEHDRGDEERKGVERLAGCRRGCCSHPEEDQEQRADHEHEYPNAGELAVRGSDETRHVAAYRRDEKAHDHDEHYAPYGQEPYVRAE